MTDWFDPQRWADELREPWKTRTTASSSATGDPTAGLAALMVGRRVAVGSQETRLEGTVASIELTAAWSSSAAWTKDLAGWSPFMTSRGSAPVRILEHATVVLDDATVGGREVNRIEIETVDVTYDITSGPSLRFAPVQVRAEVAVESVIVWLRERLDSLGELSVRTLDAGAGAQVELSFRYRRVPCVARVLLRAAGQSLVLVVTELCCWGRRVPLPRRMPLATEISLSLGDDTRLTGISCTAEAFEIELTRREMHWQIDPSKLADRFRGTTAVVDLETAKSN